MPTNLLKKYSDLLEIMHLNESDRIISLQRIFKRDIEDNNNLRFMSKKVRPIKGEVIGLQLLFNHLTRVEEKVTDKNGRIFSSRVFEKDRSMRLHWVKYHLDETRNDKTIVFSLEERDLKKRKTVKRTYIYDKEMSYIIVLEPQRTQEDYYLLTAYFLNKNYGIKEINKKLKKKLPVVY